MLIVRGLRNLHEKPVKPVVTLGNFDGLHLGHQEIIKQVKQRAEEVNGASVCLYLRPTSAKNSRAEPERRSFDHFQKEDGADRVIRYRYYDLR